MDGSAPDAGSAHFHVQEAVRHLHMAADSEDCGVCRDLFLEEVEHIEMAEDLRAHAEELVLVQAAKRAQLSEGGSIGGAGAAVGGREYVEERVRTGPRGEPLGAETVRGRERSGIGGQFGIVEFAKGFVRDRPRVTDMLTLGGRR
jgi:hypothetical protein